MNYRILIRTVLPERQHYYEYLKAQLPQAEWVFDKNKNAYDTFLDAFEESGDDAVLHMEDDAVLTSNFLKKINDVIESRPENEIINFFSRRKPDLTIGSRYDAAFNYTLCFYFPKNASHFLLNWVDEWESSLTDKTILDPERAWTDQLVADFIKTHFKKYWIHVPSLVQHRVSKSTINPKRARSRQSQTWVK